MKYITLLFLKASVKCCAPLFPIWLRQRSSVVNVCVWKRKRKMRMREINEQKVLLDCIVMHLPDIVLLNLRFDFLIQTLYQILKGQTLPKIRETYYIWVAIFSGILKWSKRWSNSFFTRYRVCQGASLKKPVGTI